MTLLGVDGSPVSEAGVVSIFSAPGGVEVMTWVDLGVVSPPTGNP